MLITYLGHSGFLVKLREVSLLFDPFITGNPLLKAITLPPVEADCIFITHAHGDHSADALKFYTNARIVLFSNYEIATHFEQAGWKKTFGMNAGGVVKQENFSVKAVSAVHSSSFPDGTYGGNPIGFVITSPEGNFYFAGDTALTLDMQLIPMWCKLDFCFLPIGGMFTMHADDASRACRLVGCSRAIGMHYNTFPPLEIDTAHASEIFRNDGHELLLPAIGETIQL
jgi:L-ascorbate metabolism protein UlaG (beta-lactamase superfamily)